MKVVCKRVMVGPEGGGGGKGLPIYNFVDYPSQFSFPACGKKLALHRDTGFRQEKQEMKTQL